MNDTDNIDYFNCLTVLLVFNCLLYFLLPPLSGIFLVVIIMLVVITVFSFVRAVFSPGILAGKEPVAKETLPSKERGPGWNNKIKIDTIMNSADKQINTTQLRKGGRSWLEYSKGH